MNLNLMPLEHCRQYYIKISLESTWYLFLWTLLSMCGRTSDALWILMSHKRHWKLATAFTNSHPIKNMMKIILIIPGQAKLGYISLIKRKKSSQIIYQKKWLKMENLKLWNKLKTFLYFLVFYFKIKLELLLLQSNNSFGTVSYTHLTLPTICSV